MAFRHGVYKSEVPTSLVSPSQGESGLPVVIGTSPVYMGDASNVNKPVLCYTYTEAVKALGYLDTGWDKWTLCEFMYSQFALYGQSPCVLINVFDPSVHSEEVTETKRIAGGEITLEGGAVLSEGITFMLPGSGEEDDTPYTVPYEGHYDDSGTLTLELTGTNLPESLIVKYRRAKPSMVTASDIIGGIGQDGKAKGLELVSQVFPRFGLIPGIILAPGWSEDSGTAAVMQAKSEGINGLFTAVSIADLPCGEGGALTYSQAPAVKNSNGLNSARQIVCWPKVKLGDKEFHMSSQLAGLMNRTDAERGGVPYKSPSNEIMQIDSCVNGKGEEVFLGLEEASYLNSQGISTALNFMSGWVFWGNRTAAYPGNTDPKDAFIPIRRMFDYVGNTFITTFWQRTDEPLTLRLIRTITDSFNVYLNGLAAREMILGGRIEFIEGENPLASLQDGHLTFHVYLTPPPPAEAVEAVLEFDPSYFKELASSLG